MGCAEAGEDRQNESPSLTAYLSQAGTAESFKIVLLVGVLLDRHLACDPGEAKPAVVEGDFRACLRKGEGLALALEHIPPAKHASLMLRLSHFKAE
jgi:hypothetical protein